MVISHDVGYTQFSRERTKASRKSVSSSMMMGEDLLSIALNFGLSLFDNFSHTVSVTT